MNADLPEGERVPELIITKAFKVIDVRMQHILKEFHTPLSERRGKLQNKKPNLSMVDGYFTTCIAFGLPIPGLLRAIDISSIKTAPYTEFEIWSKVIDGPKNSNDITQYDDLFFAYDSAQLTKIADTVKQLSREKKVEHFGPHLEFDSYHAFELLHKSLIKLPEFFNRVALHGRPEMVNSL